MPASAVEFKFFILSKSGHFGRADRQLEHAGVKVLDEHAVALVILGLQSGRVGFDAKIDVLGTANRPLLRGRLLHGNRQPPDAAIDVVVAEGGAAVLPSVLENDAEPAPV